LAGLVAAIATDIQLLIVARLFQALGGGAGLVLGRAMVRDTSADNETVKRLALMNLVTTAGPALAPVVGAVMVEALGWRPIFWALCMLGATNILLAWRLLPETRRSTASSETSLKQSYLQLMRTPVFLACCLGAGCATTSMYAFIAAAPFMFVEQMHRSSHEVGIFLGILISGITLGAVVVGRIYMRFASIDIVTRATLGSLICAAAMLTAVLVGYLNAYFFVAMAFLFTLGVGITAPATLAIAMSINRQVIGSASGLYGFAQMTVGAICTALVGLGNNPALASTLILTGAMLISQICFWYIRFSRKLQT
jgi:DHA1 family bicyclomycin/chloramphenicol resistance-like MFS transporter